MRCMKWVTMLIVLFVTGLSSMAISTGDAAETLPRVVFAYGAINAYATPTWVAQKQGLFHKHGLDVEPVFIIGGRAAQAMLAGEVHVGTYGPSHVINAVVAGGDLVMFMGIQNKVRYVVVVHPSIKRAEDLKGKRFAIGSNPAGLASLAAHVALDHMGLSSRRDNITLLLVGEDPLRLAALRADSVQATLLHPELATMAASQGYHPILDMAALNIPFQSTGLVTRRKLLKSEPQMVERIARANIDAIAYIRNPGNKKTVIQILLEKLRLDKPERAEAAYLELVEDLPRDGCPTVAGVRSILKLMVELGINPKASQLRVEDVLDLSLCQRLGKGG